MSMQEKYFWAFSKFALEFMEKYFLRIIVTMLIGFHTKDRSNIPGPILGCK